MHTYSMSHVDSMEGHEFESFVGDLLSKLGYENVEVTRGSGDQGVDILAEKEDIRYALQCKCYSSDLGNKPIQEVNTGKAIYHCHVGVVVTNRYFTSGAKEAAKVTGVLLWDRDKLRKMIEQVAPEVVEEERKLSEAEDEQARKDFALQMEPYWEILRKEKMITTRKNYTVALKADGTVVTTGEKKYDRYIITDWRNIITIAISPGEGHTIGLTEDGVVVAVGDNKFGQCNVANWRDIIAISAGEDHTVGLKIDGTVVTTENRELRIGNRRKHLYLSFCTTWRDIIAISAGEDYTVGLRADGTVRVTVARENEKFNQGASNWRDIIEISTSPTSTIGLKADGTVVATGDNRFGQCDVADWRNIIAISAGGNHTVGLKADGSVVAVGGDLIKEYGVASWKLFDNFEEFIKRKCERQKAVQPQIEEARRQRREADIERQRAEEERRRAEEERRRAADEHAQLRAAYANKRYELLKELADLDSSIKGLFNGKRQSEIKARLAEIDAYLKQL